MRLGQLCIEKVQDIFVKAPENLKCKYPIMPDITISTNGIIKLQGNLKTDKASGLDEIKHIVLKELWNEIAPVINIKFEKSLLTGQLPSDWQTA